MGNCGHHRQVPGCTACHLTALEEMNRMRGQLQKAEAECDRRRAVIDSVPENVAFVAAFFDRWYSKEPPWTEAGKAADALLAALRARAQTEDPPHG